MLELRNVHDEVIHRIPTNGDRDVAQTLQEFTRLLPNETRVSLHRPNMDDVFLSLTDKKWRKSYNESNSFALKTTTLAVTQAVFIGRAYVTASETRKQ